MIDNLGQYNFILSQAKWIWRSGNFYLLPYDSTGMTKPLQVMMICFILMMMPLAGCLEDTVDSETPEENEDVVEQQDQNEVSVIEGWA